MIKFCYEIKWVTWHTLLKTPVILLQIWFYANQFLIKWSYFCFFSFLNRDLVFSLWSFSKQESYMLEMPNFIKEIVGKIDITFSKDFHLLFVLLFLYDLWNSILTKWILPKKAECQRTDAVELQCYGRLLSAPWMARWAPLPPPSPPHPSGSSQCTSPERPVSCIEPGLANCFTYGNIYVSMIFSQIIAPSPSPTECKRLFFTSVSLLMSRI